MTSQIKKDIAIIMTASFPFIILHLIVGNAIWEYEQNMSHPLLLRLLPVFFIQFGMTCLGIIIVLIKNKERLSDHGLVKRNALLSIMGCFAVSIPMAIFLWLSGEHFYMGLGEGLFYVILADKINALRKPTKLWNRGAFFCTLIAIVIHGMVNYDVIYTIPAVFSFIQDCGPSFFGNNASIESLVLFILSIFVILLNGIMRFVFGNLFMMLPVGILIYGSLFIREKTGNAWGNILLWLPFGLPMI